MALSREAELWGCALAIERKHGSAGFLKASMAIDRFDAEGATEAAAVWRGILKCLEKLETSQGQPQ